MHRFLAVFAFAAALPFSTPQAAAAQPPVTLESKTLSVTLDPEFPRILQYKLKAGGGVLDGQAEAAAAVELNGKPESCRVTFKKLGADSAEYRLAFQQANAEVALRVTVGDNIVELRVTEIKERGAAKIKTFAFPGNALLTVRGSQPDAAVAAVHASGYNNCRETIAPLSGAKDGAESGNYFFLSAGTLAAGIASNHIDDCNRVRWQISGDGDGRRCTAQNPAWQYREIDGETVPLPWVKVIVTGDRNGDGRADWQDAALACREILPKPYGAEFVHSSVADQIAMDFASLAQQPFLRILDEVKKANLITDGIGHSVNVKGFSAEGHDSANTDYGGHYNQRAGGLKDLTFLLEHAREYNARIGVHINATEVYPEALRYKREILDLDGNGNPKGGWYWLDNSHMIDKRKDLLTGNLFASLELMRRELPKLDFVYVDVYGDHGWNAWKLAAKLNGMGLPIYSEYSSVFDPWGVWAHNRAFKSQIFRFIWNSDRDLCESDPVLRGADHVGFMGWQGERDMNGFLRCTFGRNLPTKYLQNFDLLRWEPGREALFSGGVRSVKEGNTVTVTQNGRTVMTWTGNGSNNRLFVPWDPKTGAKIYVWDEAGTEQAWELPPSWKGCSTAYLYKLTDLGRTEETKLPVANGRVVLKVEKSTPYVLYPKAAPAQKPMVWGEGSPVKDPGFDSHGFASWKPAPATAEQIRIENLNTGNSRLIISGAGGTAGSVSQTVTGLEAGKSYAASVWVQVKGERKASIEILPAGANARPSANYVTRTDVRNRLDSESKLGTNFQRLKVTFTLPPGCSAVTLSLKADKGAAASSAEFDDVRLVPVKISAAAAQHFYYEDFESVDQGWGPFVYDCGGQTQTHLSELHEGVTDDVIGGRYSFKTKDEPAGLVVRTLPSFLRLKPYTRYRLALESITDNDGVYRIVVQGKAGSAKSVCLDKPLAKGRGKLSETFATGAGAEPFLAVVKEKKGGGKLVLDNIIVDELGPAPKPAGADAAAAEDDEPAGRRLLQEAFAAPLAKDWTVQTPKQPGSAVAAANGALKIAANANVSAFIERKLPAGTTAAECRLTPGDDRGETWGVGLALFWPGGQALRVNLRGPAGRFGVDSTAAPQAVAGSFSAEAEVDLRIRIEGDKVIAEARCGEDAWQALATFPRGKFPGSPAKIRVGKMHGIEGIDDHSDPGAAGSTLIQRVRAWGP